MKPQNVHGNTLVCVFAYQNVDASLLCTISFPAFATHDQMLYTKTRAQVSDSLQFWEEHASRGRRHFMNIEFAIPWVPNKRLSAFQRSVNQVCSSLFVFLHLCFFWWNTIWPKLSSFLSSNFSLFEVLYTVKYMDLILLFCSYWSDPQLIRREVWVKEIPPRWLWNSAWR